MESLIGTSAAEFIYLVSHSSEADKVITIFRELVGERAEKLHDFPADIQSRIAQALSEGKIPEGKEISREEQIGFHLVDWHRDAAFIVALILFPEKFTDDEIQDGIIGLLYHMPAHIIEAARLGGYPTENIFHKAEKLGKGIPPNSSTLP